MEVRPPVSSLRRAGRFGPRGEPAGPFDVPLPARTELEGRGLCLLRANSQQQASTHA